MWHFNLIDPVTQHALTLRFTVLLSNNGFRRITEVMAVYFQKISPQESFKIAVRQNHGIESFSYSPEKGISIGHCEFSEARTHGKIQSKGHSIAWDLEISPRLGFEDAHYDLVPPTLKKARLIKNSIVTAHTGLSFTGTAEIDDRKISWNNAPGMQCHQSGPRNGHSWIWGHCNSFLDEKGDPAAFVFEGLTARARLLGLIPSPRISSLYFQYKGKPYFFNSIKDTLRLRSSNNLNEWQFQAEQNDLSFRGVVKAEHKDFGGLTLEDTDGSLIYCSSTSLASATIHVYRSGKLEASFTSTHSAAFEIASRMKNPYIPQLI
jgi:hypothetical protein